MLCLLAPTTLVVQSSKEFCLERHDSSLLMLLRGTVSSSLYAPTSNVTAMPYSSTDEIKSLLALQITSMVRWRSTVEYVVAQGGRMGVEFGPSNVLAKLATKISGNMEAICIAEEADLSKLEDMLAKAQQN